MTQRAVALGGGKEKVTSYAYDARGRLTDSYSYTVSSWNQWIQTHTEYDGVGNKLSVSTCETGFGQTPTWQTQSYTYDRFGNVLTFTDCAGNTESSEYDAVGRPVRKTLRDGTEISFKLDALGRVIREQAARPDESSETPTVRETVYTRTGQKKRETQKIYLRARYYDSTSGRFTAKDPQASANQETGPKHRSHRPACSQSVRVLQWRPCESR